MVSMRALMRAARSKSQLGGRLLHLAGQLVHELAVLAGQEPLDTPHVLGVLLRRDAAAARAGAQAHVRVEARALHLAVQERVFVAAFQLARHAPPFGARCGAQRDHAARDVHHVAGGAAVGVGSEVLGVGSVPLARVLDGRVRVALGERDERVGLVVLEVGVEERAVLVDEVLLQHQRLVLVLHHDVVEAVYLVDQQRYLGAVVLEVHVLAHAGTQLFRLAHIDDLAGLVLPQVHARQRRHAVQFALDAFELIGRRARPPPRGRRRAWRGRARGAAAPRARGARRQSRHPRPRLRPHLPGVRSRPRRASEKESANGSPF